MKKFSVVCCLLLVVGLVGCAHFDLAGPRNQQETFPFRNQDARWGLIINDGEAHLNIVIRDEAGRVIPIPDATGTPQPYLYLPGVNRFFAINGQHIPKRWAVWLEFGTYQLEIYPFYYQTQIFPPRRYRIDLPKQTPSVSVGRNPTAYYDYAGFGTTFRHWGWMLRVNGGNIPETSHGLPGFTFEILGNFGGG